MSATASSAWLRRQYVIRVPRAGTGGVQGRASEKS
jgi:hypothetical protein